MKKIILTSMLIALSALLFGCSSTAERNAAAKQNADRTQQELSTETSK